MVFAYQRFIFRFIFRFANPLINSNNNNNAGNNHIKIADEKRRLKLQKYEVFTNETLYTDTLVFILPGHIEKASEDILIKACIYYIAKQQDILSIS